MVVLTFLIIGAVLLLVAGLYVVATVIGEIENGFVYFAWGTMALLICVAVYLSYAVPSFAQYKFPATSNISAVTQAAAQASPETVMQQETEINLLQE